MTTDLSAEDVVVQMTPQASITSVPAEGSVAGPAGARGGAGGGAMELGRRLLLAARAGDTAAVLDLMAKGAPFTTDWLGTSPLHLAASNDHVATCGVLLRAGVSRDSRTKVERTPLHLAAVGGHARTCALLLRHGAAVDARDLLRMTPLHWAAARGHATAAAVLLRHGAAPDARSKFLQTPAQLAARAGHTALRALLDAAQRQREAAASVGALVAERLAEQETDEPQQQQQAFAAVQKIPETSTTIELPDQPHVKVTKAKQAEEKQSKPEEKETSNPAEDNGDGSGTTGGAAILRRHGITLLPPDTGGTVLSALQSGRTVVLSDAGKLLLQESVTRPTPPKVKLVQLPSRRPPVKIVMNRSKFRRLVAAAPPTPPIVSTVGPTSSVDEVAQLRAQLSASQRAVAQLTRELAECRARLAKHEGNHPPPIS